MNAWLPASCGVSSENPGTMRGDREQTCPDVAKEGVLALQGLLELQSVLERGQEITKTRPAGLGTAGRAEPQVHRCRDSCSLPSPPLPSCPSPGSIWGSSEPPVGLIRGSGTPMAAARLFADVAVILLWYNLTYGSPLHPKGAHYLN